MKRIFFFKFLLFLFSREATKYSRNTRVIDIQRIMAERCLELLNFPDELPRLVLDIGCGSGLSGGKYLKEYQNSIVFFGYLITILIITILFTTYDDYRSISRSWSSVDRYRYQSIYVRFSG